MQTAVTERTRHTVIEQSWPIERQLLCRMLNEGVTQGKIAEDTKLNRSYINRYANGKLDEQYIPQVEMKLKEYFKACGKWPEETKSIRQPYIRHISEIGVIATQDYARVKGSCLIVQKESEFGLLVGAPGSGKTMALEEHRYKNSNVYMVTCSRNIKNKSLLKKIAEELKVESYGSSCDIEIRLVKKLREIKGKSLLIIDEADFMDINSIETIRAIFDQVNSKDENGNQRKKLGILMSGNEHLAEMIIVYAENKPDYRRIRDRISIFKKLRGIGEMEAERFIKNVNCTEEARKLLISIGVNRGIRQLLMALKRMLEVTGGDRQITVDLVRDLGDIVLSFNA